MPKINFNVPLLSETGETVQQVKTNPKKQKLNAQGGLQPEVVVDAEGFVVLEDVTVKDILLKVLGAPYQGDEAVPFGERAKRGKLARKIATSNTANYRTEELTTIQDLSAKVGSTPLLAQLDDLINGVEEVVAEPEIVAEAA
jgi:hypothetical protein